MANPVRKTALEAPAPAPVSPPTTPSPGAVEDAQLSALEFGADEIVKSRNKMVQAINKAESLFNASSPAASVIKKVSADLQQDLGSATPESKHALTEAFKNWQNMGQHWNAISGAVTKHGAQAKGVLDDFSKVLQSLISGGEKQQMQAAFNAQEFEGSRQQLLGAYKTLQVLFNDEELATSLAAVQAELKSFQDQSPPQLQKQWNHAGILWGEALKHWAELKAGVGEHPVHMNSAMKKTFQHWNSVAMGTPSQPAQPTSSQEQEPVENLIAVMRQKAKMQGPDFAKQFDSIVKSTPPEKLRPWLEQQLLGKTSAMHEARIATATSSLAAQYSWLHTAAEKSTVDDALKLVPAVLLDMIRTTQDQKLGPFTKKDLQQSILDVTRIFNAAVTQDASFAPLRDVWNAAARAWAEVDDKWEAAGVGLARLTPPLQSAVTEVYEALRDQLSGAPAVPKADPAEEPAIPLQQPQETMQQLQQQQPQQQLRAHVIYKGARYTRVDQ